MLAASIHAPLMDRGGLGIDVTYGEYLKANLVVKVLLKRWGGE